MSLTTVADTLKKWIPPHEGGGSRFGMSFLSLYLACPARWALAYVAPHSQGRGLITPHKARPLLAGGGFHSAVDPWYTSRCKDPSTGQWCEDHGRPDLDFAMHTLDTWVATHAGEWDDPVEMDTDHQLGRDWVRRYHDYYGPGGTMPEYPNVKVFVDETGPWVEREIVVPLGQGLEFTSRIDLVAIDRGYPAVYEHKTAAASSMKSTKAMAHLKAQFTGELFALGHGAKLPFQPSRCVVNILNKNPGQTSRAKTLPFEREAVSRTEEQIARFALNLEGWLSQMGEDLQRYEALLEDGVPTFEALYRVFPLVGTTTGACFSYQRACDFWPMCSNTGREHLSAVAYDPRYRDGEPTRPLTEEEEFQL